MNGISRPAAAGPQSPHSNPKIPQDAAAAPQAEKRDEPSEAVQKRVEEEVDLDEAEEDQELRDAPTYDRHQEPSL